MVKIMITMDMVMVGKVSVSVWLHSVLTIDLESH